MVSDLARRELRQQAPSILAAMDKCEEHHYVTTSDSSGHSCGWGSRVVVDPILWSRLRLFMAAVCGVNGDGDE